MTFNTQDLQRVLQDLDEPASFLLDTFFTDVVESDAEEIEFHKLTGKRRITPLVHPTRAGKVVDNRGYTAEKFSPAYAKDKRRWNPNAPLKRARGEQIGGTLTPQQRMDMLLLEAMEDQLQMLTMREEVMASEALRTGKVTVAGEGYEPVVVDFLRHADLSNTLAGNHLWSASHADSNPLEDLEEGAVRTQLHGGAPGMKTVMDPASWAAMRARLIARGEEKYLFDYNRSSKSQAELGPMAGKVRHIGLIGDFDITVYSETYVDDAGVTQQVMPAGTVIMGGPAIEGARCYGAILDAKAGFKATRYFTKTWSEEDPPIQWLLLQSAPLVAPFRANASYRMTVL